MVHSPAIYFSIIAAYHFKNFWFDLLCFIPCTDPKKFTKGGLDPPLPHPQQIHTCSHSNVVDRYKNIIIICTCMYQLFNSKDSYSQHFGIKYFINKSVTQEQSLWIRHNQHTLLRNECIQTYKSCNIRFEKLFSWNANIDFLVYKETDTYS